MEKFRLHCIVWIGLFLVCLPNVAQSFSVENWIEKVRKEKIYLDPEWIKLNHYVKNIFGNYKSVVNGPHFFQAADGKTNPQSELEESLRKMWGGGPQAQQVQCRLMARRDFFRRKFNIPIEKLFSCPEKEEWIQKLSANKIYLVFASAYMDNTASSFGHTFLRLHNSDNKDSKELLDYSINYAARTDGTVGALYALYGVFGYFPGSYSMLPHHHLIKEYTHLEGRDLWEYELNLTQEEVRRVVWHMLELDETYIDYFFIDDNCAFQIIKLIEVARPYDKLLSDDEVWVIPVDTIKVLQRNNWIHKVNFRPSLTSEWKNIYRQLSAEERSDLKRLSLNLPGKDFDPKTYSTRVLDAALTYAALRTPENLNKWKESIFLLAQERAARKSETHFEKIPEPLKSPVESHDSSMVGAGVFSFQDQTLGYFETHAGFHPLLSEDSGVSPYGHLQGMNVVVRKEKANWRLHRLIVLDVISSQDADRLFFPWSWGLTAKLDSYLAEEPQRYLSGGGKVGYSFDIGSSRWMNFVNLAWEQDYNMVARLSPGFQSQWVMKWSPRFRSHLSWSYRQQIAADIVKETQFQSLYDLSTQWEIWGGWIEQTRARETYQEVQIGFRHHFIF